MTGFLILILLVVGLPYLFRLLRPYILRWMQRRMDRYVRNAMGVPPDEKRHDRRRRRQETPPPHPRQSRSGESEPLIPKEYAEDVTFTEIHSYSEDAVIADRGDHQRVKVESQVSDAEIIEIKSPSQKK